MTIATEVDLGPAEGVLATFDADGAGVETDDLIPLLRQLQEAYGYLPPPVLMKVSKRTGIPTSQMYGVITFYSQFYMEPHGKHTFRCCRGTACHVRGGQKVIDAAIATLGIEEGETTEDMLFSLETVACLGTCALAPVAVVDDTYYGKMTARRTEKTLQQIIEEEG